LNKCGAWNKISKHYQMAAPYTCKTCRRGYHRKIYYNRHVALCELMGKTVKERGLENEECDEMPTVRVLYNVILELTTKLAQLEKKMEKMTKWADLKKKKMNIIDWLNENQKKTIAPLPFETFLERLKVERTHLLHLFQTDYTTGIGQVLQEVLPREQETNPVKAFEQKPQVFFVYEQQWAVLTDLMLQKLINIVRKQLLDEFIIWQKENAHKMEQDDFAIKYATNVKKITAGNLSREQIYSRVKLDLYKYLKAPVKIVNCEVELV
jgi:hypothetical protein